MFANDDTPVLAGPAPARRRPPLDLEVVVVYTHEQTWIGPLLDSLAASGDDLRMRLLLVDNASEEGVDQWCDRFAETRVLRRERRFGYGPNLNHALRASTARYVLLLNTDMVFDPVEQCLSKLVRFMDARPDCGLSSCRLYKYDGEYGFPARRFPNWRTVVGRRLGRGRYFRDDVARHFYADRDPYATQTCDWVTGCCMLIRRETLAKIGPLDEGFAKYFEDVDWCARVTAAGNRVMLCGDTYAFHAEQRASKKVFSADARRHLRSYARWLWKYRRGVPQAAHDDAASATATHAPVPRRLPLAGAFPVELPSRRRAA